MGKILDSTRAKDNKIILTIQMKKDELERLKSRTQKIYAVSDSTAKNVSSISQKGFGGKSIYFDVPRLLRLAPAPWKNTTKCIRFEGGKKIFFCYVIDKIDI